MKKVISLVDDAPSVREDMMDLPGPMDFGVEAFERATVFPNSDRMRGTSCLVAVVQMSKERASTLSDPDCLKAQGEKHGHDDDFQ
jgi:FixJ family two-component response regulator